MAFDDGASITGDFQFELSVDNDTDPPTDFVFGVGVSGIWLDFTKTAPDGLFGHLDAKTQDVSLFGVDGGYANPDYQAVRVIHLPVILRNAATEADLFNNLTALQTSWAPKPFDAQLALQWPGLGLGWYLGRPRGMTVDISLQRRGVIRALLRFDAMNPVFVGA